MDIELTNTTEEIMNFLWQHEAGLPFRQIYNHFTLTEHKAWKRQTLYTHLTILMDKGFIRAEGTRRKMLYIPGITLTAYREILAQNILNKNYEGSLLKFVSAFMSQHTISPQEAESLTELLKESSNL